MPVTNGCKSSAILNGHHKVVTTANLSSKIAPAAKPVTPAADINKTTATTTAPSEAPSFRVLTWNSDWIQCSGHEGVFAPSKEGTIWKKTSCNPSSKTKSLLRAAGQAFPEAHVA